MKRHHHDCATGAFFRSCALLILASAIAIPAGAQQSSSTASAGQDTPPSAAQQQALSQVTVPPPPKEGFWGRVNPFARKKWVRRHLASIKDQLIELDEVNARNARDIKDVDQRAQAGIRKAQDAADAANQTATSAGNQAQAADSTAEQAANHVNQLNATVDGLDQYHQVSALSVVFDGDSPVLTDATREQLDGLAASLTGRDGYILEMDAHSPLGGSAGIQASERLAESVERYLVIQHQIPIYRMRFVALGNAPLASTGDENGAASGAPERIRTGSVQIRLMENSLAAQAAAPPQGTTASTGTEQP